MNPRTKLAFFNDDEDESINIQVKPLDDQKAKTFSQGIHRKSKREKEKEAEAAKREEEEREAAKAYAEFLDEFEGPSANKTNAFVRASDSSGTTSTYTPSMSKDIPTGPRSQRQRDPSPPPDAQPKPKGKRAMDAFLEELKRDQADREARLKKQTTVTGRSVSALAAYESQVGSRDRGDPLTTNVFVSNLPTTITEHSMGMFFAKMGPVGSVKIMWPRGDHNGGPGGDITSRRKTSGMSGFVSYMARSSAEACVREMDGYTWNGSVLRVGWSRAVPIAAKPMYDLSDVKEKEPRHGRSRSQDRPTKRRKYSRSRSKGRYESRSRSRSRSRDRHRKRTTSYSRSRSRSRSPRRRKRYSRKSRSRSRSYSTSRSRSDSRSRSRSRSDSRERRNRRRSHSRSYSRRSDDRRRSDYRSRSRSRSRSPAIEQRRWPPIPSETKSFITTISNKVKNHGKAFENVMKQREKDNPKFVFMHDSKLPEYHFYKSLVDPNYRCPYADIPFEDEGDMSVYSTDSGEESERERTRKGTLGRIAKRRFETMLRSMTGRRGEIARCMAFSLEHADAVEDVADIITSSICVTNTPVPRKVARLHVICDILHNGAATIPNVWKFRQEFQLRLPDVFDHLSTIYHSFPGRITAETFKKQIVSVVEIWEDWIVFPHEFTTELRNRLDGVTTTGDAGGSSAGGGTKEKKAEDTKSTSQPSAPSKFTSGGFKPATEPVTAFDHKSATGIASGDDEAMSIDGDDVGDEDLDGMAVDGKGMDDDLDGGDLDGEYIST